MQGVIKTWHYLVILINNLVVLSVKISRHPNIFTFKNRKRSACILRSDFKKKTQVFEYVLLTVRNRFHEHDLRARKPSTYGEI